MVFHSAEEPKAMVDAPAVVVLLLIIKLFAAPATVPPIRPSIFTLSAPFSVIKPAVAAPEIVQGPTPVG